LDLQQQRQLVPRLGRFLSEEPILIFIMH
jgi:hypothetical protein